MAAPWHSFDCPGSRQRWRLLDDGRIEIDGEGAIEWESWPERVNSYRPLLEAASAEYDIPAHWLAAIMALETKGCNVCLRRGGGICEMVARGPAGFELPACSSAAMQCDCSGAEGCGVMAVMASGATMMAQRGLLRAKTPVRCVDMMADVDLSIRAGAAHLTQCRQLLGPGPGDDFVNVALCHNAWLRQRADGSWYNKCGSGSTFGTTHPKESCPDPRGWGVVVGCVHSNRDVGGGRCAPAQKAPGMWVCTNEYPRTAIRFHNAAVHHYLGVEPPGPEPSPPTVPAAPADSWAGKLGTLALGGALGYLGARAVQRLHHG